ncbi:hypothetical protein HOB30_02580 [Candidatus Falkowbacteria bacterium]|jgi:hypothetical protein|nr:hypothetical protein [Candidatus Falkowbacteria bacterium]
MSITTFSDSLLNFISNSNVLIVLGIIGFFVLIVIVSKIRQTPFQKSLMEFDSNMAGFNKGKITFICNENDSYAKKTIAGYQEIIKMNNKSNASSVELEIKFESFIKPVSGVWLESKTDDKMVVRMYAINTNK